VSWELEGERKEEREFEWPCPGVEGLDRMDGETAVGDIGDMEEEVVEGLEVSFSFSLSLDDVDEEEGR
jgi:hypothetical protein